MARRATGFFIGEAIRLGWESWKRQWLSWSSIVIAALVAPYLPGAFGTALGDEAGLLTIFLLLVTVMLSVLVSMGLLRVSLKSSSGEPIQLADLFGEWRLLPRYLATSLLYGLIIFGGTLLFVVPGFLWAITFQYYAFFILEGEAPIQALKSSARITAGRKWDLFALQYVLSVLIMLGFLLLGLGLLVAIPVALVANAVVYQGLTSQGARRRRSDLA